VLAVNAFEMIKRCWGNAYYAVIIGHDHVAVPTGFYEVQLWSVESLVLGQNSLERRCLVLMSLKAEY